MATIPSGDDMNRERAKELLPIIEAFVEGKDIEFRPYQYNPAEGDPPDWSDLPKFEDAVIMTFPCDDYEYRIKTVPREFWIDLSPTSTHTRIYKGRPIPGSNAAGSERIKVREVIE